ncbi:MAG: hypothetical protein IKI00_06280 [Bacteroidales bacterium]|nr:hypothetical protein [Bacteroidales bacterium]
MEQNKEMTVSESLALITETLNNNRKEITRRGGKYFILWGILLAFFSLLVYALWKSTGHAYWNNLWFAMPLVGYPLARMIRSKEEPAVATNVVSRIVSGIWTSFGVFACSVAAFTVLFTTVGDHPLAAIVAGAGLTVSIVLLFGLAETISGVALKNWAIKIAGFVTGIGGVAIYYLTGATKEQMFIFTLAGLVLVATGLIVKRQNC